MFRKAFFYTGILLLFFSCTQEKDSIDHKKINIENQTYWKENSTVGTYGYNSGNLGFWGNDTSGLPVFHYTGLLPTKTIRPDGKPVSNPEDPWFLLGNYHFTLFANASGKYLMMSLERSISRLNDDTLGHGKGSFAYLETWKDSTSIDTCKLLGLSSIGADSKTEKAFGCGFVSYRYDAGNGLKIKRTMSTIPSNDIMDGCSAFLLNVEIENTNDKSKGVLYTEGLTASYDFMFRHNYSGLDYHTTYPVDTRVDIQQSIATANFNAKTDVAYATGNPLDHTIAESYPPQVRLQLLSSSSLNYSVKASPLDSFTAELSGQVSGIIAAHSKIKFSYVIGYVNYGLDNYWTASAQRLLKGANQEFPFRQEWQKVLKDLSNEKNDKLRNEMLWNQYTLLSMTNWNEWLQDLYIPQGNIYEYGLGVAATTSDFLMHSLPLCHSNPEVAKSVIRGILKQTDFRGEINPSNEGACRVPAMPWKKSHTNFYMTMALAEYFDATGDVEFLNETIPFWGLPYSGSGTVLDRIERIFIFMRDEIYKGKHGLVRVMLSDWNDCFYFYFKDENFFSMFRNAESVPNSAMAVQYLSQLSNVLEKHKDHPSIRHQQQRVSYLIKGMRDYKNEQLIALMNTWGDRPFLLRAYLGSGKVLGMDTMYLESQTFTLGINEIAKEKRLALWEEIKKRIWNDEKMGARQGEKSFIAHERGSAENGGFWYSLNGPMILGLATIDKAEAWKAFNRITFANHAHHFPDYWVGMWSGPDTYDSSISPGDEGLIRAWGSPFPVFCAHAHAWSLLCYYHLILE